MLLEGIVHVTNRKMGGCKSNGALYNFITNNEYNNLKNGNKLLTNNCICDTDGEIYQEGILKTDIKALDKNNYICLSTPIEVQLLKEVYHHKKVVVPIVITIDDKVRLERLIDMEYDMSPIKPNYAHCCEMYLENDLQFEDLNTKYHGLVNHFDDGDRKKAYQELREFIWKIVGKDDEEIKQ